MSPDNKFLVALSSYTTFAWNLAGKHPLVAWTLPHSGSDELPVPVGFAFDADEPGLVASLWPKGSFSYLDLATGSSSPGKNQARTQAINKLIANRIRLPQPSGQILNNFDPDSIDRLSFSAQGNRFAVSSGTTVWVGDVTAGTITRPFQVPRAAQAADDNEWTGEVPSLSQIEFSPDGEWLAANTASDGYFGIWYVDALELPVKKVLDAPQTYLLQQHDTTSLLRQINYTSSSFRWLPNSSIAVQGGIWSLDQLRGEQMLRWNDPQSWSSDLNFVAFARDQRRLVTTDSDSGKLGVWDQMQHTVSMQQVDWGQFLSPDGSVVFDAIQETAADKQPDAPYRIRRWNVQNSVEMASLTDRRHSR